MNACDQNSNNTINMADHDDTSELHHVELHTKEPNSVLNLFMHTYGFSLVATRMTNDFCQWLLESHQCRLLISSMESNMNIINNNKDDYDILTTIIQNQATRELIVGRNTVFNVALNVKSVQAVIDRDPQVQVNNYLSLFFQVIHRRHCI